MDVTKGRIFCAEQINVPTELPNVMKEYTKEMIKNNPVDTEKGEEAKKLIYEWSLEYFKRKQEEKAAMG